MYRLIYPFSKEFSSKLWAVRATTLYDASADADQKLIAPPKGHFFEKVIDSENILQKLFPKKLFGVEK